jgi:hypothetical protein
MKRIIIILSLLLGLLTPVVAPTLVLAQTEPLKEACDQTKGSQKPATCYNIANPNENPITGPNGIIIKASRIIALITGAAAVIVIMVAGLRYIVSAGDPNSVNTAKNAILYAMVGLVVSVFAPIVIGFVLQRL